MRLLLFVSVLVVIVCLGVLVSVMASGKRKSGRDEDDDSQQSGRRPFSR
jgi:hypothetical protein